MKPGKMYIMRKAGIGEVSPDSVRGIPILYPYYVKGITKDDLPLLDIFLCLEEITWTALEAISATGVKTVLKDKGAVVLNQGKLYVVEEKSWYMFKLLREEKT